MSPGHLRTMVAVVLLGGAVMLTCGVLARGGGDVQGDDRLGPAVEADGGSGDAPDAARGVGPARPRLRMGEVPLGSLGHPLGDSLTVEGRRVEGRMKVGPRFLRVETVNGQPLLEPVGIEVANVRELPRDTRIVLQGYETGAMIGPVPAAIEAARKRGEAVLLPQFGWRWQPSFVALEAVQPELALQEVNHGFKVAKARGEADKEEPR